MDFAPARRCIISPALTEALCADGSPEAQTAALRLYRGPFADDLTINDDRWNTWVDAQRTRYRAMAADAYAEQGAEAFAAGDFSRCLELAENAIAVDPLRNDNNKLLIRSL